MSTYSKKSEFQPFYRGGGWILDVCHRCMLRQDMATAHGLKGWSYTLRISWTYAQHRCVFDLLSILNKSTSTYCRLIQHPDYSTSTYSSACFARFHQGGAKLSRRCRFFRTHSRLISTYPKEDEKQKSNLSIAGDVEAQEGHPHTSCPKIIFFCQRILI